MEAPIPAGWKLWTEPHVPPELTQFAMAVRDRINDYPYDQIAETTTAPDGRTVGAFKSVHSWSYLKQPDGTHKLVTGLHIPGISLVVKQPPQGESIALGGRPVTGFGDAPACPVCPAALPSGSSASRLIGGDWSALPLAVGHTLLRSALVASGLYAAGERAHVVRNAVAGSFAIETFVLGWAAWKRRRDRIGAST